MLRIRSCLARLRLNSGVGQQHGGRYGELLTSD